MLVIVLFGCYGVARAFINTRGAASTSQARLDQKTLGTFPAHVGNYTLVRSWNENLLTGPLLFHWADYAPADGGTHISIGISPVLGSHDTLICHSARGEDPLWHSQLIIPTAGNVPISFSASLYNDGATQYLEATTLCNGSTCGEYSSDRAHFGFVYSKPNTQALFTQDPQRPIPILLRAETIDTTLPADKARTQMAAALSNFLAAVNLDSLTQPYRHP